MEKVVSKGMLGEFGSHRLHESELVNHLGFGNVRKQIADPVPAFTALFKIPLRLEHFSHVVELGWLQFPHHFAGILTVVFLEKRFVVKGIDVRRPAIHVEKDDVLCFRGKVRRLRGEWVGDRG